MGPWRPDPLLITTAREPAGGSCNALVLDDEAAVRAYVSTALRPLGFQCREAADLAELAAYNLSDLKIVVLDLSLGKEDAIDVLEHLADASFDGRVLLMSGYDATALLKAEQLGRRLGLNMTGSLRKPFRPEDLNRVVDQADL